MSAAHVVEGKAASSVRVDWNGASRSVAEMFVPAEWSAAPETGLAQGGDVVLMRLAGPFDFAGKTEIATGPLDDRFAVLLGTGRGGNGVLGVFDAPAPRGATNVIDRQIATPGGGGMLVTDFDDGTAAHNSLDAASVSMRYYDDGFGGGAGGPVPSDVLFDPGDASSAPAGMDGTVLRRYFPALPEEWLEGTTASGDSGGPLMVFDETSGEWRLAGVTSWGFNPTLPEGFSRNDSRYGDVAFFTDLTRHADWIAATVPEPSPAVLVLLGWCTWMLATRRRGC